MTFVNRQESFILVLLIQSACDDEFSEVSLLKIGADDYLVKPVRAHILLARIQALLRRSQKTTFFAQKGHGSIYYHPQQHCFFYNDALLQLTEAEFDLLQLLYQQRGKIVSREDCCKKLRGIDFDLSDRSIDMRISGIRKRLGDDKPPYKVIMTVRNRGYRLVEA